MMREQLLQKLKQQIEQLYASYQSQQSKLLYINSETALFSENSAPLKQYLAEIQQTFDLLKRAQENQQFEFFANKLVNQCQLLSHALEQQLPKQKQQNKYQVAEQAGQYVANKTDNHPAHKLPPRQRLQAYYQALSALNQLIDKQRTDYQQAKDPIQKQHHIMRLQQSELRKQRCIQAIEELEETLLK